MSEESPQAELQPRSISLLAVCSPDDEHFQAVGGAVSELGAEYASLNLSSLRNAQIHFDEAGITIQIGTKSLVVDARTTVWWRRAGNTSAADLEIEESRLVADENPHALIGALDAAGVRWIDHPDTVSRAERKLFQLGVAKSIGLDVPDFCLSNDLKRASSFQATHDSVIAKTLSPGVGVAPYTDRVDEADLPLVKANPVLLQEEVSAVADLRVVVVGGQVEIWRRPRSEGTLDWRSEDPSGEDFVHVSENGRWPNERIRDGALRMNAAMGLTTSVQDWLETKGSPVFLEVNPQGNWLFLEEADDRVTTYFARLLVGTPPQGKGEWPRPLRRARSDFMSKKRAPSQDGVVAPQWIPPAELRAVSTFPQAVDLTRADRGTGEEAASRAEEKAARLLQTSLALIALGVALLTYQVGAAANWLEGLWALPALGAILFLVLAAVEAAQIDRVGIYRSPRPKDLLRHLDNPVLGELEAESEGAFLAHWTADKKFDDLLQAWAWFSRGLAALITAALIGAATFGLSGTGPNSAASAERSTTERGPWPISR